MIIIFESFETIIWQLTLLAYEAKQQKTEINKTQQFSIIRVNCNNIKLALSDLLSVHRFSPALSYQSKYYCSPSGQKVRQQQNSKVREFINTAPFKFIEAGFVSL